MSVLGFLRKTFAFDYRSMALYRFFLGVIVMADVVYRIEDITNFYTDIGLVPRSLFLTEMGMPWSFSLHLANGSLLFAVIMFAIHFISGLFLAVGYRTKFFTLLSFIFTVSIHNRNWLVNNGGDDVLRAILFISIFLPLGRFFSIDSAMRKTPLENPPKDHFSFWTLAYFLQVFCIYFVSYILKDHPIWRSEFTAVFFSSRLDIFATPLGILLRDYPWMMKLSTAYAIFLEWLGPILLVFGFIFGKFWWVVRLLLVVLFIGLHVGIFLTMNIGLFTFICMTMWVIFIPGPFWDKLISPLRQREFGKLTLYYDKECGFCHKMVRIIRAFFLLPEVQILEAQSDKKIEALMREKNSWVVAKELKDARTQYSAWLEIVNHSPILYPFRAIFSFAPVKWMGERSYRFVSNHRPLFGKLSQWLEYSGTKKEILTFKVVREVLGLVFFVTLFMWNLTTIRKYNIRSPVFQTITRWLHVYQEWNMFAPYPKMDNIWIEVPGVLSDGTEIELITGSKDMFSIKDQAFYDSIPNEHWRKFYLNLSDKTSYARYFGSYLCRKWNERNIKWVPGTTLRKFEVNSFSQVNLPDGGKGEIVKKNSWRHWCFDEDFKAENPK